MYKIERRSGLGDVSFEIAIPPDDEGYILLQCSYCGEFFKLLADDCKNEGILDLYCPACGLISETYITKDVFELAMVMAENYAMDKLYSAFKDLEHRTKNGPVKIKASKSPKRKEENPIRSGIEAMEISYYECCKKNAKIKPLLKFTGSYCPCCGVKNYEVE